jgi:hypothetical protein
VRNVAVLHRNWMSSFEEPKINDKFVRWNATLLHLNYVETLLHLACQNWWQGITGNVDTEYCWYFSSRAWRCCHLLAAFLMRKNQQNGVVFLFITLQICYWALKLLAIGIIYVTHQTTINSNDLIFILNLSTAVFISQYLVMQPLSNYIASSLPACQ